ncbi:MAG: DUF4263 domain-containing protein [Candidatus Shapirobacteria bacterium]|nr:DUF4263 domain-containing protein [Candidatus Shapirobacteria bacterium]
MNDDIFNKDNEVQPTEGDIVLNSRTDTLYSHDFKSGEGKFFNIITTDEDGSPKELEVELTPRIRISLVFIKEKNDINGVYLKKFRYHKTRGWIEDKTEEIKLSYMTFQKLIGFLKFLSGLDLKGINERRLAIADDTIQDLDQETARKIKTLLAQKEGPKIIEELLSSDLITSTDIVNIGYRKNQLEIFEKILNQKDYFSKYKSEHGITDTRPESVWQHFFEQNDWIFGYGLNYVFNEPLAGKKLEQIIQGADVVQSGKRADGLLKTRGILNSLCLVEIKTHSTKLLKQVATPYRADSWQVSDDLNGGVVQSQKTIQKTIENIKLSPVLKTNDKSGDPTGEVIFSYQPKSYLIIGNLAEFQAEHGINQEKFSSFELFRKNVLSPEIITFDELYERAKFIVYHNEQSLVK